MFLLSSYFQRKRVSFPDTPVSSTKKYMPNDANVTNSPNCIRQQPNWKNINLSDVNLSPKVVVSRLDLTTNADDNTDEGNMSSCLANKSTLQMNDTAFEELEPAQVVSSHNDQIKFDNEADMYKFVFEKLSLDEMVAKHAACSSAKKGALSADTVRVLTQEILSITKVDEQIKDTVLDDFSEEHPTEFLDRAVQENYSELVCQRLPINSILDFVFAEPNANHVVQARILTEVEQILSDGGDAEVSVERMTEFLQKVLSDNCLTRDAISQMIVKLFANRPKTETFDLLQNLQRLLFID
jgi:hypothetical protein